MIVIDQRHLTFLDEPDASGQPAPGHVTSADSRLPARMSFKAPPSGLDQQVLGRIHEAVSRRDIMPSSDLEDLDSLAIWPLAMVTRGGRSVGWLTRIIDRDYYVKAQPPGSRPTRRLFELQLLCASTDQLRAMGIARSAVDDDLVRLALTARLAYAIEIIHRPYDGSRLSYGDLNLRTAAVAIDPPRILLLGCDAVADIEDTSRVQPNAPFFVPPEPGRQDQITDIYKLGLCVIRCLSVGRGAARIADAASPLVRTGLLDPASIDLLNRAVSTDRSQRPTAEEIKDCLIGRVLQLAAGRG
jgi:hypothetical protein